MLEAGRFTLGAGFSRLVFTLVVSTLGMCFFTFGLDFSHGVFFTLAVSTFEVCFFTLDFSRLGVFFRIGAFHVRGFSHGVFNKCPCRS